MVPGDAAEWVCTPLMHTYIVSPMTATRTCRQILKVTLDATTLAANPGTSRTTSPKSSIRSTSNPAVSKRTENIVSVPTVLSRLKRKSMILSVAGLANSAPCCGIEKYPPNPDSFWNWAEPLSQLFADEPHVPTPVTASSCTDESKVSCPVLQWSMRVVVMSLPPPTPFVVKSARVAAPSPMMSETTDPSPTDSMLSTSFAPEPLSAPSVVPKPSD